MKSLRLLRWSGSVLSPRTRPSSIQYQCQYQRQFALPRRLQSTAPAPLQEQSYPDDSPLSSTTSPVQSRPPPIRPVDTDHKFSSRASEDVDIRTLPSPPPSLASSSAKLSALHARLLLSPRLPLETLARCLIDASADANPQFNNASLAILGSDILGYYTSESILCRYPRLPTEVTFAAMWAYCGPKTLAAITREWGVEIVAAPGGEVDPGLLQFSRRGAGNASVNGTGLQVKELDQDPELLSTNRPNPEQKGWRRGVSSRTVYDDYFGEEITRPSAPSSATTDSQSEDSVRPTARGITVEEASSTFVRALFGALYLHTGLRTTKAFYTSHILSRHLDFSSLFSFCQPTRDLSRLCARENFESPVARILSETGRKSRHPVFVVGVFSGREKLGEGAGASLDEARIRAAIGALKGWYLYSPLKVSCPSEAQAGKEWEAVMVDGGEVVV